MQRKKFQPRLSFTFVFLAFLLLGCMHQTVSYTLGGNPYKVEIWASDACPDVSETLTLRATVTNVGSRIQTVELVDQPVLDIVVNVQGKDYRWSEGKPATPDLTRIELKPGESKNIEMPWLVQQGFTQFIISAQFVDAPSLVNHPISASISTGTIEFRISNGTNAISKVGLMPGYTTTANLVNEIDAVSW
jgi:hypothetical protein